MGEVCYDRRDANLQCDALVKIDWFDTTLNYALIALNIILVLCVIRISPKASDYEQLGIHRLQKEHLKNKLISFIMFMASGKISVQPLRHYIISDCSSVFNLPNVISIICGMQTLMMKVIVFQILLCIGVCCVGVSIVWCASLGWILMLSHREYSNPYKYPTVRCNDKTVAFTIGANLLVVIYYGLITDIITTVAHCSAILLGMLLWVVFEQYLFNRA